MSRESLVIGGASGYWGDSSQATAQLLRTDRLDFIVYDYLAEITMSLLARARARDSGKGYAVSFLTEAMIPNLKRIDEMGVKIVSNAGGVNPEACAQALASAIAEQGLSLKVAWVEGDDLIAEKEAFAEAGATEMFSGAAFPETDAVQSINAYLGAFPIAAALDAGADIVVTGRCVDSAVTLGACIHRFGWGRDDLDELAMASLAGHLLECGVQSTGGNFTDWEQVQAREYLGYPLAEIDADGSFICTKPANTGGLVSVGTVSEQLVYEIGDPRAYALPDVVCDFSEVKLVQEAPDRVRVSGARGRPAPANYKASATYADKFRGGTYVTFYGIDAEKKASAFGDAVLQSSRNIFKALGMPDFSETSVELIGAESQFGEFRSAESFRELVMKIAVKHASEVGVGIALKQIAELALATPPGLSGFAGNSPKIAPVVRLFSMLVPKERVLPKVHIGEQTIECADPPGETHDSSSKDAEIPPAVVASDAQETVPLVKLAWGRSGDKGNNANIGIIARRPEYLPWIDATLTTEVVAERFAHFLADGKSGRVDKFHLPGIHAINFVLHDVLGGGGIASLRNDPQAKGYSQLLLSCPVAVPAELAENLQ